MLIHSTATIVVRSVLMILNGLMPLQLGGNPFEEATEGMFAIYSSVKTLLEVVLVLGALVTLARVIIKVMDGNREAAQNLAWWFFGLVLGFIMLEVIASAVR